MSFMRFPEVLKVWKRVKEDVAAVCLFREQEHKTLVQVGIRSFTAPPGEVVSAAAAPVPRITREDIHEFTPIWVEPSTLSKRWAFPEASQVITWWCNLRHPESPVRALSWFQLSILFERQTQLPGVEYHASKKRYTLADRKTRKDFTKRTNQLSRWVQGVFPDCRPLHLKPHSSPISFWTMCASIRVRDTEVELMDHLLSQHQKIFTQVRQLRDV